MKKLALLAACAATLSAVPLHAEDVAPKDQKDKVSYSIGLDIGMRRKQQGLDVNADQLSSGIKDAITAAQPKLSQEEMQKTMQTFMEQKQKEFAAENQKQGEHNKAKVEAFL